MALKKVDDFDGVTEAETVGFTIDGVAYEIDLSQENREKLHKDFKQYTDVARRLPGQSTVRRSPRRAVARTPAAERTANNDAIRHWARSTGRSVTDRGRIPRDIVDAFNEAHESGVPASMFSNV